MEFEPQRESKWNSKHGRESLKCRGEKGEKFCNEMQKFLADFLG